LPASTPEHRIDQHQRVGAFNAGLLGQHVRRWRGFAVVHRPVGHAKARIKFFGVQVGDFEGVGWIAFRQAFGNLLRQHVSQRTWIIVVYNNQCVHGEISGW